MFDINEMDLRLSTRGAFLLLAGLALSAFIVSRSVDTSSAEGSMTPKPTSGVTTQVVTKGFVGR